MKSGLHDLTNKKSTCDIFLKIFRLQATLFADKLNDRMLYVIR